VSEIELGPGVPWWRISTGLLLLLLVLNNLNIRYLKPELLPSNQTQWFAYIAKPGLLVIIGLILILFGVRAMIKRSKTEVDVPFDEDTPKSN